MAYFSRADWGARPPRGTTPLGRVSTVIVHHTAGSAENPTAQVQGAQRYHMDTHGWGDIAYHYLVATNGDVYEGRGFGTMGGATLNWNESSYAICAIGSFDGDDATDALVESIAGLINWGIEHGFLTPGPTIWGHRDAPGNSTGCPGGNLEARLGDIAARVNGGATVDAGGSSGPAPSVSPVRDRQDLLNKVGCGPIAVDGVEGPQTRAATACWQRKLNIAADGQWGPQTQAATDSFFAWLASQQPAAPAPAPAPGPDLSGVAAGIAAARTQVLRRGSKGDAVFWLQACLNNVAGANLVTDSDFGPMTERAVKAFQRDRGLTVDGIVGPQTWGALLG